MKSKKESIMAFFATVRDELANRLVLAVSIYIQNEWFLYCARVYGKPGS